MKSQNFNFLTGYILISLFCLLAPLWAPHAQVLDGKNLMLTPDSFQVLGISLIAVLFSSKLISDSQLRNIFWNEKNSNRCAIVCALYSLLFVLVINYVVFHSFYNSADEFSCYFLAKCIEIGRWWVNSHPLSEFFNVVHVGNREGKWFSVYPAGWPVLFALGLKMGLQNFVNPTLTLLSALFMYVLAANVWGRKTAFLGVLFLSVSPFFLFTGASYFSHSTCLFMGSLFLLSAYYWDKQRKVGESTWLWASLAGFSLGYGLTTRYLTMAIIATPFCCYLIWKIFKTRKLTFSEILFGSFVLLFIGVNLWQNVSVTGNWLEAPNHFDKPWERLGFKSNYLPQDAIVYFIARIFYLFDWTPPILILLYFANLKHWWENRSQDFFRSSLEILFLLQACGYMLYFSWGGNQYGPRYWYESFPWMIFTASAFLVRHWQSGTIQTRKMILGVSLSIYLISGYQNFKHAFYFERVSRERKELYRFSEASLDKPSIIFIHGFLGDTLVLSEEDAVRNTPLLNERILYAHDLGPKNAELMRFYPNRNYYRGTYDRVTKQAKLEKLL